jgi:tetratricopeptide (TPR) repeat protein
MNPTPLKLIFKGRLEFGSQRTFDMVVRHWNTRLETYYKTDVLFKPEQVFDEEGFALNVPQQTIMSADKPWRSTTSLLQEVAQFAVAGSIGAWRVQNGQVMESLNIEPKSDKAAVTEYQRGCELVRLGGMENEASVALSRAIEKYERNAAAYERRGYVNYRLKNYNDALYDFSKSIAINPNNPEPYYGKAKVEMVKNNWESAVVDFDQAIKRSLALQPLHWLGRLKKGESLLHAKRYGEAAVELRLYLQRTFAEQDPNYRRRHRAWIVLGKALLGLRDIDAALDAFLQAKAIGQGLTLAPDETNLLDRVSTPDFKRDLEAAMEVDGAAAMKLLEV